MHGLQTRATACVPFGKHGKKARTNGAANPKLNGLAAPDRANARAQMHVMRPNGAAAIRIDARNEDGKNDCDAHRLP
jgi:hypothetical protein